MIESEKGMLGTKEAKLVSENDDDRHWMAYGPDDVWVQFDLMKLYRVDEIRIWNYKQNVGYDLSQRGMRNVRVEYVGLKNADWHPLETLELCKADDRNPTPVSKIIEAKGKQMRLIRITSVGDIGEANWFELDSGQTEVGLGQVRFYGTELPE